MTLGLEKCFRDTAPYGSEVLPDVVFPAFQNVHTNKWQNIIFCNMINIISEQIPLT